MFVLLASDSLFVLKLIDVTSVELQQHQKTEDGAYSSGFIIYFNPGTCEGLEDGTSEVRVKCRNDIESMEWVTMIDAQQDISKDKHAEKMKLVAVAKDAKAAKDSDVKLGREQKNVDSIDTLIHTLKLNQIARRKNQIKPVKKE